MLLLAILGRPASEAKFKRRMEEVTLHGAPPILT